MINVTSREVKAFYRLTYDEATADQPWMRFTRRVDTNQPDGEKYGGEDPGTGMQEKGAPDSYRTTIYKGFTLPIRGFKIGRILSKKDVESNKVAKAESKVREISTYAAEHPGDMVEELILDADAEDPMEGGTAFFYDDHARQGSLADQSNLYAGTTTSNHTTDDKFDVSDTSAPTDDEWGTILFEAARILREMTNTAGQRINRNYKRFTVATNGILWVQLLRFMSKRLISSGESNEVFGNKAGFTWNPMHLPSQTDDDYLYFFVEGGSPMIVQYYEEPNTPKVFGPGTEHYDKHDEMLIKASGEYNVGFEHYVHALKVLLK